MPDLISAQPFTGADAAEAEANARAWALSKPRVAEVVSADVRRELGTRDRWYVDLVVRWATDPEQEGLGLA